MTTPTITEGWARAISEHLRLSVPLQEWLTCQVDVTAALLVNHHFQEFLRREVLLVDEDSVSYCRYQSFKDKNIKALAGCPVKCVVEHQVSILRKEPPAMSRGLPYLSFEYRWRILDGFDLNDIGPAGRVGEVCRSDASWLATFEYDHDVTMGALSLEDDGTPAIWAKLDKALEYQFRQWESPSFNLTDIGSVVAQQVGSAIGPLTAAAVCESVGRLFKRAEVQEPMRIALKKFEQRARALGFELGTPSLPAYPSHRFYPNGNGAATVIVDSNMLEEGQDTHLVRVMWRVQWIAATYQLEASLQVVVAETAGQGEGMFEIRTPPLNITSASVDRLPRMQAWLLQLSTAVVSCDANLEKLIVERLDSLVP